MSREAPSREDSTLHAFRSATRPSTEKHHLHARACSMLSVRIRKNDTGEEVIRPVFQDNWQDAMDHYRDGNGSCDCNRVLEWRRGMGWSEEDVWEDDLGYCIGVGKYAVALYDGEECIYQDDGNPR